MAVAPSGGSDPGASAEDLATHPSAFVEANAGLPERTLAHDRSARDEGHPAFLFLGIPHVLHWVSIALRGVEVIRI